LLALGESTIFFPRTRMGLRPWLTIQARPPALLRSEGFGNEKISKRVRIKRPAQTPQLGWGDEFRHHGTGAFKTSGSFRRSAKPDFFGRKAPMRSHSLQGVLFFGQGRPRSDKLFLQRFQSAQLFSSLCKSGFGDLS